MGTNSGEWEQMALTDTKLRGLRPREKPYSQSDGGGLLIEVMPGGKRVWRLRYRLAGRQEKVTLGEYPTFSLTQARQWLADCRVMIERGESPMKAKREEKAAKLLVSLHQAFFPIVAGRPYPGTAGIVSPLVARLI